MSKVNKVRYQIITTTEYVEDSGIVTAYGIGCRKNPEDKGRETDAELIIPNISTRFAFVEELIGKLNSGGADPEHLHDFIYDFLP